MAASSRTPKTPAERVGEFLQAIAPEDMRTCRECPKGAYCKKHAQQIMKRLEELRWLRAYEQGRKV